MKKQSSSSNLQFTVAIIGLGVIGGSLGLAIKQNNPQSIVVGFDSPDVMRRARQRKAIDRTASTLEEAVSSADIVFLCTPVSSILRLVPLVSRFIKPRTIVTDVGSVKGVVEKTARRYFDSRGIFVGGHPMAGSEWSGINYADPLLFQNAVYVLCPLGTRGKAIEPLVLLLRRIGARILKMDAKEHDRVAATVSHLPQLLAVGLMNLAAEKNRRNGAILQLAAGGFRDMTRIASSSFPLWKDILANNRGEVRRTLREFEKILRDAESALSQDSLLRIKKRFLRAKLFRDAIPRRSKGFLHPLYDIFVWVDDRPGMLMKMTSALYRFDINIGDIELLKVREGEGGTFRLSFESGEKARLAMRVLRAKRFRVVR